MARNLLCALTVMFFGVWSLPLSAAERAWQEFQRDGEAAFAQDRISEAARNYRDALAQLEKEKVAASDPKLRHLLLDNLPDLIERLCQDKLYDRAEALAQAKLATVEKVFGKNCAFALDALQDLQLIYAEQKMGEKVNQVLLRYSGTTVAMREAGKEAEADDMVKHRSERLQRKLKEQFERIQQKFESVL